MAFWLFSHLALFWFTSIKKSHRFSLWLPGKPAMIVRTTYAHKHIYLLLFICSVSSSMTCQIDYVWLCCIYTHVFHLFLGFRFDVFRYCVWKHSRQVVATNRFFTHATADGKMLKEPEQKIWQTSIYMRKATKSVQPIKRSEYMLYSLSLICWFFSMIAPFSIVGSEFWQIAQNFYLTDR